MKQEIGMLGKEEKEEEEDEMSEKWKGKEKESEKRGRDRMSSFKKSGELWGAFSILRILWMLQKCFKLSSRLSRHYIIIFKQLTIFSSPITNSSFIYRNSCLTFLRQINLWYWIHYFIKTTALAHIIHLFPNDLL